MGCQLTSTFLRFPCVNVHVVFSTDVASRVCSTFLNSDLAETHLHPILNNLVVDAFDARRKKDDDPNDYGCKLFGPDDCHRVENFQTIDENAGSDYITHQSMMKEEWEKQDIVPVMKKYMEPGETTHVLTLFVLFY